MSADRLGNLSYVGRQIRKSVLRKSSTDQPYAARHNAGLAPPLLSLAIVGGCCLALAALTLALLQNGWKLRT